jgi:hypothetical protein
MPYMTLEETAEVLAKAGKVVTAAGLLRIGVAGQIRIVTPLSGLSYSPTLRARIQRARSWLVESIKSGKDLYTGDDFDHVQLEFLARCSDELMRFKRKTPKELALIVTNPTANSPIEEIAREMANTHLNGLYWVPPNSLMELEAEGRTKLECVWSLDGKEIFFPHIEIDVRRLRMLTPDILQVIDTLRPANGDDIKAAPVVQESVPMSKHIPKRAIQETAILEWLKNNGYFLQDLPKWKNNAPGVKSYAREAMLKKANLFSDKSFELAWKRLSDDKKIRYSK